MKKISFLLVCVMLIILFSSCAKNTEIAEVTVSTVQTTDETAEKEEKVMKLFINDKEIPVIWEDNTAVKELTADAAKGDITVQMSMYSDNEQVGSLGRSYTAENKQTTTHNGDIVLYNSSNIVVFYGSNSWSYTRLGKMNLPEKEVTELLSKGNVTVTLR